MITTVKKSNISPHIITSFVCVMSAPEIYHLHMFSTFKKFKNFP